jgi:uncharacterized protein YdhG (YjbR/CyaY superfamily)
MRSDATTVDEYLAELPPERRAAITAVRDLIREHLPEGYEEAMNWGMIAYQVPLATYADPYNGQPLMYAALSSQKNYMSLYFTAIYMDEEARATFEAAYRATGKRLDVAKSCVRCRTLADLPLDLVAETVASVDVATFVQRARAVRSSRRRARG